MWWLILSSIAWSHPCPITDCQPTDYCVPEDQYDRMLAKTLACNEQEKAFNLYRVSCTQRLDSTEDKLRLCRNVLGEITPAYDALSFKYDDCYARNNVLEHAIANHKQQILKHKQQKPLIFGAGLGTGVVLTVVAVVVTVSATQ